MENQEQFLISRIIEDMSDGVIVISFAGKIVLHNRAAEHILRLPEGVLKNKTIAEIMRHTDENDKLFEPILESVFAKQKVSRTVPFFRDEETLYLRITTDFLMNGEEKIAVITTISDITEGTMLFIANKRLAGQVIDLMNSFVEVMVTAIDAKSPYNANHTKSMVKYAKRYLAWLKQQGTLAQFTSENTEPLLMSIWLHDIGKLLVPQEVMDKPTRLGSAEKDIRHRIETASLMLKIKALQSPENAGEYQVQLARISEAGKLIFTANTAGFLDDNLREQLFEAAKIPCFSADGRTLPLLNESELEAITVQRGTLTAGERKIIESHVSWTDILLSKMEFRGDYKPVPKWAAGHHELLDGSGYPEHLKADKIPWETRLLTIIDVYDALTAEDRPYKPPLPPEKAFEILTDMAEKGKVDIKILKSFRESEVWKH